MVSKQLSVRKEGTLIAWEVTDLIFNAVELIYMKIGLDFDNTIFDTADFYADFPCSSDVFLDVFEMLHLQDSYTPLRHASLLRSRGINTTVAEIMKAYRSAPDCVRDREYLRHFCKRNEVYLVTRASHIGWQRKKADLAGLKDWFVEIRVARGDESKEYGDLDLMVDDNAEEIRGADGGVLIREDETLKGILSEIDR